MLAFPLSFNASGYEPMFLQNLPKKFFRRIVEICLWMNLFFFSDPLFGASKNILPGRLGNDEVKWARFGSTDVFFYMSQAKQDLVDQIMQDINQEKIKFTVDVNDYDCFTTELSAIASKYPDSYSLDPEGSAVLNSYAINLNGLLIKELGLHLDGISREINFVVNQDAHKFHQDQSAKQFTFLNQRDPALPPCRIIQDLTLVDWDMSIDTFSATILQDAESQERFLLMLHPKETVGMLFTQSPKYLTREAHPSYLVPTIFPYHAVLSPIDLKGTKTPGSSKGKRISTVLRGVVLEEELELLRKKTAPLSLNRPTLLADGSGEIYSDGIVVKEVNDCLVSAMKAFDVGVVLKHPDRENVEILELKSFESGPWISQLVQTFGIDPSLKLKVLRVIKRDSGFSSFHEMNLPILPNSEIIALNASQLPEGYDFFNLARDWTPELLPWVQLYHFPKGKGFKIPYGTFQKLSLTPIEEVLFRVAKSDSMKTDGIVSFNKIVTKIDLLVFESN